ncbi:MAG: ribonuclease P protein component, partial [Candidatus Falkowbacteria bacterium]|nr:ribonuclease P protein component [Candidatus Falkowbacteria bacterium]
GSFFSKNLGFKVANNHLTYNRVNIIVSAKVSKNAVIRNKTKRQIREIIRTEMQRLVTGKDLIIIALPPIVNLTVQEIKLEIQKALQKLKLYQ